jgi:hypothetical protein
MAMAFDVNGLAVDVSGNAKLGIAGDSPGDAGYFFGDGDLQIEASSSSGPWSGLVCFDGFDGFAVDDAYLMWTGKTFALTFDADGLDNDIFDVEVSGSCLGGIGIPKNPGIKLGMSGEGFDFFALVNNEVGSILWNFGAGLDFSMEKLGIGLRVNSDGVNKESQYGAEVTIPLGPLDLTAQYGGKSPEGGDAQSGYFLKGEYGFAGGSSFSLAYNGDDLSASKVEGELTVPFAEKVDFVANVTSETCSPTVTSWEVYFKYTL